jgi:two-component system response regulator PilR (NtrC family)
VLERAIVLGAGEILGVDSLPASVRYTGPERRGTGVLEIPDEGLDLEATLDAIESRYLQRALDRTSGVQTKAADTKMTFRQLDYKPRSTRWQGVRHRYGCIGSSN